MAKSTGNILTVSVLESKGYDPLVYRMFCLLSHYRKPLEFSYDVLDNVKNTYQKLLQRIANLKEEGEVNADQLAAYHQKFVDTVGYDLNTASGITLLYDMLKDEELNDATKLAVAEDYDKVLSLDLTKLRNQEEATVDEDLKAYVEEKIAERKAAKKAKDFATADAIREELAAKGIRIKDTREGTIWEVM